MPLPWGNWYKIKIEKTYFKYNKTKLQVLKDYVLYLYAN